jgi:hypothetical protein
MSIFQRGTSVCLLALLALCGLVQAQDAGSVNDNAPLTDRERKLLERVLKLEERVEMLEKLVPNPSSASVAAKPSTPPSPTVPAQPDNTQQTAALAEKPSEPALPPASFLGGTTLNVGIDGYYSFNFNNPIGRVNLLRAYDVSSNAFSLNQASVILDNQPTSEKRWGFRLDMQYGQASQANQGNPNNEPRPALYQNLFQAYGSYLFAVGKGLRVDVGKFASSLGAEGNYTKDQLNYSRAFLFTALPFYHMGVRVNYQATDSLSLGYWLVNGTQQTEPFNGFKDQYFGAAWKPHKSVTWNVNYYLGQDHPDTIYYPYGGAPAGAPSVQGVAFEPIPNAPNGKQHIFDTVVNWQATSKLTVIGEGDYVVSRLYSNSTPAHMAGTAFYLSYQFNPKFWLTGRFEYVNDRGAYFGTASQALKETTLTAKYQLASGFDIFGEWRRDFSNQPYFYTDTLGVLKKEQNTATLGLVWWWGAKQEAW